MKIGILTFHYARNYGATLQAYGLQEVLQSMGHQVQILNYHNPQIAKRKSPFALNQFMANPISYLIRVVNIYPGYKASVRHFKDFEQKHLHVTREFMSRDAVRQFDGDYIIIGSDQVWNPLLTGGPDPVYWGMHKPIHAKLMTYAASSGDVALFQTDEFRDISVWLRNFNALSVREERLKEYVEKYTEKNVKVVVDPTLLAGRDIFERITAKRLFQEPYILLYHVESSPALLKVARYLSKQYHARIISISRQALSERLRNRDIKYCNATVSEMLSLIKYAECVVALSFHGTALSVLYEKDFYSVTGMNMGRVKSFLDKIGLSDRVINDVHDIRNTPINWEKVHTMLEEVQIDSIDWLKSIME